MPASPVFRKWTAIPRDVVTKPDGSQWLRISLLVSLLPATDDAGIALAGSELTDWPAAFGKIVGKTAHFNLLDPRGNNRAPHRVEARRDDLCPPPDSDLWKALIVARPPATDPAANTDAALSPTRKRKGQKTIADRRITTFSESSVSSALRQQYGFASLASLGISPITDGPTISATDRALAALSVGSNVKPLLIDRYDAHGRDMFRAEKQAIDPSKIDVTHIDGRLLERDLRRLAVNPADSLRPAVLNALQFTRAPKGSLTTDADMWKNDVDPDLLRFRVFHGRVPRRQSFLLPTDVDDVDDRTRVEVDAGIVTDVAQLDAFDRIASASNFHRLLRPLGLVTDWLIRVTDLPENSWNGPNSHFTLLQATVDAPAADPSAPPAMLDAPSHPVTAIVLQRPMANTYVFRSRDRGDDSEEDITRRGFARIDARGRRFQLVQGDIARSAFKIMTWAQTLMHRVGVLIPLQLDKSPNRTSLLVPLASLPWRAEALIQSLLGGVLRTESTELPLPEIQSLLESLEEAVATQAEAPAPIPRWRRAETPVRMNSMDVWMHALLTDDEWLHATGASHLPTRDRSGDFQAPEKMALKIDVRVRLYAFPDDGNAAGTYTAGKTRYLAQFASGSANEEAPAEPPPKRYSGGFSLLRVGRGAAVGRYLDSLSPDANGNIAIGTVEKPLFASDLILGYAPDVRLEIESGTPDKSGKPGKPIFTPWHCLTRRHERFHAKAAQCYSGEGEAVVRPPALRTTDDASGDKSAPSEDLLIPETIFTWNGQSLGADEPGLFDDPLDAPREEAASPADDPSLAATLSVPDGSLVPVRFYGQKYPWTYCFRMRVYDVAGNAPVVSDKEPFGLNVSSRYTRQESIDPPILLLDKPLDSRDRPKRRLNRMVITDWFNVDRRCIAPPRILGSLADSHGILDVDDFRDAGSFNDVAIDDDGNFPGIDFLPDDSDTPQHLPIRRRASGRSPTVPYWPDPLARRLRAELSTFQTDLPVSEDEQTLTKTIDFLPEDRAWPRYRAISLELRAGPQAGLHVENGGRRLVVELPPGTSARLVLHAHSSDPEQDKQTMAVWHDMEMVSQENLLDNALNKRMQELSIRVRDLPHLAFSTPVEVELCHAVIRPQEKPSMVITPRQTFGNLAVPLDVWPSVHAGSSGTLSLIACWNDPITSGPGSHRGEFQSPGWNVERNLPQQTVMLPKQTIEQTLPDLRRRTVRYRLVATSRFADDFPDAPSNEQTCSGDVYEKEILCAMDVPPLQLSHVVSQWRQTHSMNAAAQFSSLREQAGFRLYFRNWYVTGIGEKLGIALHVPGGISDRLAAHSVWGVDPLVRAPATASAFKREPNCTDFGRSRLDVEAIWVQPIDRDPPVANESPQAGPQKVGLICFDPAWDAAQGLWYVDVPIESPPARGLVRLMLVRYQEGVLRQDDPGINTASARASTVLQLNFEEVRPSRTVVVWRDPQDPLKLQWQVQVPEGPSADDDAPFMRHTAFSARIYQPDGAGGWVEADPAEITPCAVDPHAGAFRWRCRTGPRKFVIVETESFSKTPVERVIYFDVLDI